MKELCYNHPVLRRHEELLSLVHKVFKPDDELFFIKAPGRVNLIGEHTDYNMGPVLPCAINKEIVFCMHPNDSGMINVINVDKAFAKVTFDINQPVLPDVKGHWSNYIKAGVKGIVDHVCEKELIRAPFKGFDAIVSGSIPVAAGLSSSSALVVASALACMQSNCLDLDKREIAEICAQAEHFVGTAGGGMDQAASLLGQQDTFLRIDFNPLRTRPVHAPADMALVLFHSMESAEKSHHVRDEYNRRVMECRMAIELFNSFQNRIPGLNYIGEINQEHTGVPEQEIEMLVNLFLDSLPENMSVQDFLSETDISDKDWLERTGASHLSGINADTAGFMPKSRFKHVYYECKRVHAAITALQTGDTDTLGRLLNESHSSLADNYQVSTPGVDELVRQVRANGASGARIMGAGFGGVVLALCNTQNVNELVDTTIKSFYNERLLSDVDMEKYIFPCVVSDGAGVLIM